MDRDQSRGAERDDGIAARRAVIGIGTLAIGLAFLSWQQSAGWRADTAVWAQAQAVAPELSDPWIHGAQAVLDAPGDLRAPDRLAEAERLLDRARAAVGRSTPEEQRWAQDAIAATTAVIRMRQGRLLEASRLMTGAPIGTARGQLCAHFRAVCALAASPGSS